MATPHATPRQIRTRLRLGLPPTIALLAISLLGTPAQAANPTPFTGMQQPISVAAQPKKLLATRFCADKVLSINQAGTITTFAQLPSTGNACLARDVVVSPGLGGFPPFAVYAVQEQTIYKIPKQGGTPVALVTIPSLHNSETSLSFDTVGTFGFSLLASDRLGEIWKINKNGFAQLITNVNHHVEGIQVAPSGFAPFGGQILGTDDSTNSVFAVDRSGVESPVVTYDTPESVEFVPQVYCEFLQTGGTLFVASQFGDQIFKFPASDFTDIDDGLHALVMTKAGKIGLLETDGTTVTISDWQVDGLGEELEDATFFPCL